MHTQNPQTGPTSLPGKAVSCLNSLTHGGASQTLFLPGENPADFHALLEDVFAEFQPGTLYSAGIAADAAVARWFVWRRQRALIETEAALSTAKPNQTDWSDADLHRLNLFDRYKTQAERAARRAFVNVEALRKETTREIHWQTALEFQKQRFALETERFLLAKDKQTRLAPQQELKARRAADALANLAKQKEQDEFLRANPFEGRPSVHQDIWITTSDDAETEIEMLQSNEQIRFEIASRQDSKYRPEIVVRCFHVEGSLPEEFAWLTREEPVAVPAAFEQDENPPTCYYHPMNFETFAKVSAKEDSGGNSSILCHFPFEEEEPEEAPKAA
jgi:hypothetical protein